MSETMKTFERFNIDCRWCKKARVGYYCELWRQVFEQKPDGEVTPDCHFCNWVRDLENEL